MSAATEVFNIPELLELILLCLPCDTDHQAVSSMRTIHTARTVSRTWHELIRQSTVLRQRLYLPTPLDVMTSKVWSKQATSKPARLNPWTPNILLNQRSWGSANPFENALTGELYEEIKPSKPKYWNFFLELSMAQYKRLPAAGTWRKQLVASPPFTNFWYTRCFYELGSGWAPFVTHLDYNAKKPKSGQKYFVHCPSGATLGDLVDAYTHLFEKHSSAKFVMIESVRCRSSDEEVKLSEDRPMTRTYMPGLSAERSVAWQC